MAMLPVEVSGIMTMSISDDPAQRLMASLQDQMHVIGHETICANVALASSQGSSKYTKVGPAVSIRFENILTSLTSRDDMIPSILDVDPCLS